MILVFEMVWTGTVHAPGNSVTIQTIAAAFPDQTVRVFAETTHLRELRADTALTAHANVEFREIAISPHFRSRPQIVSFRRGMTELAAMRAALRDVPPAEPCLIMLISATPTAVFAASSLARLSRRRIGVQVGMHGNLNDAIGWRPRNPLARAFDLHAALKARHGGRVRFLVLEDAIRRALSAHLPGTEARTDVLPLPVNLTELPLWRDVPFQTPIRIGLVGQATEAKGITPFLDLARHFTASHPGRVSFHLVGRAVPGDDLSRFAPLADPVSTEHLSRADFLARLSSLHFVCLPLREGYYDLSASGALIDAITWLKPVIATALPIVRGLFEQFGEIGYLCGDPASMEAAILSMLGDMDAARYANQVDALRRVRASRMPDALAEGYRALVRAGFAGLLP